MDTSPRWHEPTAPGRLRRDRVDPRQLLNEGLTTRGGRRSSRSRGMKLHTHAACVTRVSFHVQDPGEGDSARGLFTGQWQGVVRPLLDWTTEER